MRKNRFKLKMKKINCFLKHFDKNRNFLNVLTSGISICFAICLPFFYENRSETHLTDTFYMIYF